MTTKLKTALFDAETNGFLNVLDRIHVLAIREMESGDTFVFRHNDQENNIERGLKLLEEAEMVIGHNIIGFDIPALTKVYPKFRLTKKIRDTLVMVRMMFPQTKEKDFRLFAKGGIPGYLIGAHKLEAWGYRLGLHKGDYSKNMKAKGLDPWAEWNQDMEDYCVQDLDTNEGLWALICRYDDYSGEAITLEHKIHELMARQEEAGVPFDLAAAKRLALDIEREMNELIQVAREHFGTWWAPKKKHIVQPVWNDPKGINKKKKYKEPRPEFGEDMSRAIWADVKVCKKTMRFKSPLRQDRIEGATYCEVELKEFNPGSRDHVIDRFTTVYDWEPIDFTKTGKPSVNDSVLQRLRGVVPYAEELAEIFYLKKRWGQITNGKKAWTNCVGLDGRIHHYCNVGGTVSGRASHIGPNMSQVPSVEMGEDEAGNEIVLKGREGRHGYECRKLFHVPDGWIMLGADLKGIEYRCLANVTAEFDGGALVDIACKGSFHQFTADKLGVPYAIGKRLNFCIIYGGGFWKIGHTVDPVLLDKQKFALGKKTKSQVMSRIPGLGKAEKKIKKQAKSGKRRLYGLDGRWLLPRSDHSALNLKLQSDGAIIAKKWLVLLDEYLYEAGLDFGWDGDYVFLIWSHDEIQLAVRPQHEELVTRLCIKAAKDAGLHFKLAFPVEIDVKVGMNWAETH